MTQMKGAVKIHRRGGYWEPDQDSVSDKEIEQAAADLPTPDPDPSSISTRFSVVTPLEEEAASVSFWRWVFVEPEKRRHDFRVVSASPTGGADSGVWMDGKQLLGVKAVDVHAGVHEINLITITFMAETINKDE